MLAAEFLIINILKPCRSAGLPRLSEIKVKVARLDIRTAETNIKNLESVDTFMKGKFTNLQLYRWMTGKLSGLYFQTYKMALDLAKWAQRSFQFELGYKESEVGFISSLYWDSLKKGLLAGETLQVDLVVALDRVAAVKDRGLETLGLDDKADFLRVNERMETGVKGLYAIKAICQHRRRDTSPMSPLPVGW